MRYVLLTGIGRGIGFALTEELLRHENIHVIGISRQEKPHIIHDRLTWVSTDIGVDNGDFSAIHQALEYKLLSAVIHNAAVLQNKPFGQYSRQDLEHQFNVNVFAPFLLTQAISDYLKPGSHIVNIGSMGGYQGSTKFPGLSAYSASKAALSVFTECLAEEWKSKGISVNCLALGSVNTEMLAEAFPGYVAPTNPDEIADFIVRFAIQGHQFFNGKIIPVSVSVP